MMPIHPYSEKKPPLQKKKYLPVDNSTFVGLFQEYENRLQAEEDEACSMSEHERYILNQTFASVKCEFSDLDGLTWTPPAKRLRMYLDCDMDSRLRIAADEVPSAVWHSNDSTDLNPEATIRCRSPKSRQQLPLAHPASPGSIINDTPTTDPFEQASESAMQPRDTDATLQHKDLEHTPQSITSGIPGVKNCTADVQNSLAGSASLRKTLKRTVSSRCLVELDVENRANQPCPSTSQHLKRGVSSELERENRDPTDHFTILDVSVAISHSPDLGSASLSPGQGRTPLPRKKHSFKRKVSRLLALGGKK